MHVIKDCVLPRPLTGEQCRKPDPSVNHLNSCVNYFCIDMVSSQQHTAYIPLDEVFLEYKWCKVYSSACFSHAYAVGRLVPI